MTTQIYAHGDSFPFHSNINVVESSERCVICGRKLGANFWSIEVTNGGSVHDQAFGKADETDGGYMGWWAIGSECRKQFPETATVRAI